MILIDTNALIILIIGLIDPNLINAHKRTSIYDHLDYEELLLTIGNINNLIVLPNVWTEVDNLLNNFRGNHKYQYIEALTATVKSTTEIFITSLTATESPFFHDIGLTDALLLEQAKQCKFLITSDSKLSDYATALGIRVYDVVKERNKRL